MQKLYPAESFLSIFQGGNEMEMENQIQIFNNPEFGILRTILIKGEPWFVGKDATSSLGYSNTRDALIKHVDEEDKIILNQKDLEKMASESKGRETRLLEIEFDSPRGLTFINESGLYSLIFSSNLPKAKEFKRWVTSKVLPSIRKYGYYVVPNNEMRFYEYVMNSVETDEDKAKVETYIPVLSLQIQAMIKKFTTDYKKVTEEKLPLVLDFPDEIWKWIKDYEGLYQVSTLGRVRSFQRGKVRILKPHTNEDGYLHLCLSKNCKAKDFSIHRLVAETFIPNPDNLPEVDHRDNNHTNNRVDNLRWTTRKENAEYAVEQGAYKFGDNHPRSKLTVEKVREIREKYIPHSKKYGIKALAKEYGVSKSTIENVVYNQVWKHVK